MNEITGFGGGQLDSAHCHQCRAYRPVSNSKLEYGNTGRGRPRIKANCFVCGTRVTRMVSKDVAASVIQRQAALSAAA